MAGSFCLRRDGTRGVFFFLLRLLDGIIGVTGMDSIARVSVGQKAGSR